MDIATLVSQAFLIDVQTTVQTTRLFIPNGRIHIGHIALLIIEDATAGLTAASLSLGLCHLLINAFIELDNFLIPLAFGIGTRGSTYGNEGQQAVQTEDAEDRSSDGPRVPFIRREWHTGWTVPLQPFHTVSRETLPNRCRHR